MRNLFKIAVNSFRESLREPVYSLMLLAALLLIGHYPSAAIFVFSEQLKLVVDSSMATGLLFGLIIAVLCASNTVAREMRNGTVLLMMSKPVSRWSFILGKIIGVTAAAALFTMLCNLGCVISVFVATDQFRFEMPLYFGFLGIIAGGAFIGMLANFLRGSSFPEVCTYALTVLVTVFAFSLMRFKTPPADIVLADLCKALLLVNFAVVAMATIAVVMATKLDVVPNLCVCTAIFFMGLLSNYLFQRQTDSALLNQLLTVFYSIFPNWQFFWLVDAVAVKKHIPLSYVGMSAVYMVLFVILASLWAVVLFQNKEVAGDSRN
jgi:ABC-type transport system involved in multi-copper enzyme maturation permease subunit